MKNLLLLLFLFPSTLFAQDFTTAEIARWKQQATQITIIRDNWGIPHIYGKSDADAVFGLMYAQCEDDFKRVEANYIDLGGESFEDEFLGDSSIDATAITVSALAIAEVGVIEPLVVYRKPDRHGRHLLLDGHLRRAVLLVAREQPDRLAPPPQQRTLPVELRLVHPCTIGEHLLGEGGQHRRREVGHRGTSEVLAFRRIELLEDRLHGSKG